MTISTPILNTRQGSSIEESLAIGGEIPDKSRASAYLASLMDNGGKIVLECQLDQSARMLKLGLVSMKSAKLSPGRYSYSIEITNGGSKQVFGNYLLVQP